MNSRLAAAFEGATRSIAGEREEQVTPELPAPLPEAATFTRFMYAAACVLMSRFPTVTPLAPGRWQLMQRAPITFA